MNTSESLNYTARFRRSIQPAQYETAEAEVSVSGRVSEGEDLAAAAGGMLDKAAAIVLARLTQTKVGTNVPTASAPSEEKRGPGRPKKTETPPTTAAEVEDKFEKEAPKTEPNADALAGVDPTPKVEEKDLPAVLDAELTRACSQAAPHITPKGVKDLYEKNYRVARVAQLAPEFRRPFLKDLDALVEKAKASKKGE